MTRRVLFVAYAFPPIGGAGVQRTTKFVKYLPEHGWLPSVLTVANPSVPVMDESLCEEIPPEVKVVRAKTWEPGYAMKSAVGGGAAKKGKSGFAKSFVKKQVRGVANLLLQPDPQILWAPHAIRAGIQLLKEVPHDAIFATGPPFSCFSVGYRLSRKFGIPLILDYRDEWELSNVHRENQALSAPVRAWQRRMQKKLLRGTAAAVATTEQSSESIREFGRKHGCETDVHCIYNGFDPADFEGGPDAATPAADQKYRICYVGTLWNLTSVRPLVDAIKVLCEKFPAKGKKLELVIAGRRTPEQEEILAELNESVCSVRCLPYMAHGAAIELMRSSHELALLLADTPDAARVVPAKLFEYMAAQRPVLNIAPRGEVWELLQSDPHSRSFLPSQVEGIAEHLAFRIDQFSNGESVGSSLTDITQFSRPNQARQLAELLASLTGLGDFLPSESNLNQPAFSL